MFTQPLQQQYQHQEISNMSAAFCSTSVVLYSITSRYHMLLLQLLTVIVIRLINYFKGQRGNHESDQIGLINHAGTGNRSACDDSI